MPRANAMADLVQTTILTGDYEVARSAWQTQWEDSAKTKGWARWLIPCRLASARAELELQTGNLEAALEWSRKTIDLCIPARRLKYEAVGRMTLGRTLLASGRAVEAVDELRLAVARSDELGSPAQRWPAAAALAKGFYAVGDDAGAEAAAGQAIEIVRGIAAGLSPERSARFLAAGPVKELVGNAVQL